MNATALGADASAGVGLGVGGIGAPFLLMPIASSWVQTFGEGAGVGADVGNGSTAIQMPQHPAYKV